MAGYIKVVLCDKNNEEVAGGKIIADDLDQGVTTDTIELSPGDHILAVLFGGKPTDPATQTITVKDCDPKDAPKVTFRTV